MQWFVHRQIERYADLQADALDLTMGNGYDTLFLAQHFRHVTAIDKQPQALEATRQRLESAQITNVTLALRDHATLDTRDFSPIRLAVFNAGYFPSGDKTIITEPASTVHSLTVALELLESPGALIVTLYSHPGGETEKEAVVSWLHRHPHVRLSRYHALRSPQAPEVYLCEL